MRKARSAWPFVAMDQAVLDRAVEVQDLLADRSQHSGAKIADLLIAAAAEATGLVVLHYDHDYDLIAKVTHQATEWVVRVCSDTKLTVKTTAMSANGRSS